jgi:hypothetical protein
MRNKLAKKKPNTQYLYNMINCIKSVQNFSKKNSTFELYIIEDYQKEFDGFFNKKTLPVSIEKNLIIFNLNDEVEYIRCQISEELAYENINDDFFDKQCLVKIWSETLFYTLKNSIKNSSIIEKYGTNADDYDWECSNFIQINRRSKYKESLFSKYNLNTFLNDAYLENNRIYLTFEPKFAERLRFLVGDESEKWLKNCVQETSVYACREWVFSIPTENELNNDEPLCKGEKSVSNFILDNRLIVNWEPSK